MTEPIQEEKMIWSGRYRVIAKEDHWKHEGKIYDDQIMTLFQVDMDENEARSLLERFGFTPENNSEDYPYLISQVEETFNERQADQLVAYLEALEGITAWKEPAYKPIKGHAGAGAITVGGSSDFYMFTEYDGYCLDFKAWGYYRVSLDEE